MSMSRRFEAQQQRRQRSSHLLGLLTKVFPFSPRHIRVLLVCVWSSTVRIGTRAVRRAAFSCTDATPTTSIGDSIQPTTFCRRRSSKKPLLSVLKSCKFSLIRTCDAARTALGRHIAIVMSFEKVASTCQIADEHVRVKFATIANYGDDFLPIRLLMIAREIEVAINCHNKRKLLVATNVWKQRLSQTVDTFFIIFNLERKQPKPLHSLHIFLLHSTVSISPRLHHCCLAMAHTLFRTCLQ